MRGRSVFIGAVCVGAVAACSDAGSAPVKAATMCETAPFAITIEEKAGSGMADKTLALTFDDGPAEHSAELSAYLASAGIAATFFVNGANVRGREAVLDQELADGHLVGNHTETHAALTTVGKAQVIAEVSATDELLAGRVPDAKLFFRPPFGDWNEDVMQALAGSAMAKYHGPVGWDIGDKLTATSAADWDCWDAQNGTRTVTECGDLYLKEIREKKRGVVLMHDGPPGSEVADNTLRMIEYVVPLLKAEGYTFARVDQVDLRPHAGPASTKQGTSDGDGPPADPCRNR